LNRAAALTLPFDSLLTCAAVKFRKEK